MATGLRTCDNRARAPGRIDPAPEETRTMALLVMDPKVEERLKAEREESGADQHDEVWDGVYVMSPLPNNEHQYLASQLCFVLQTVIGLTGRGLVFNGVNVSDREGGW